MHINLWGQAAEGILLRDLHIVDVVEGQVLPHHQIWILGDSIQAVGPIDADWPSIQDTVYLGGKFVTPGFTDAHVHHFQSGGLYTRPDVIDLRYLQDYEKERGWLHDHAPDLWRRYLAAGITSTVDLGGPFSNFALRQRAAETWSAPNLWVSGPLLSSYLPPELMGEDPPILKVESPEEARAEVRRQVAYQPDLIKIWYILLPGESPSAFEPVAQAIIEEAKQANVPVAVHATQLATARTAVRLGADILVHSVEDQLVDEDFVNLMLANEVSYCPTLTVGESYEEVLASHLDLRETDWALAHPKTLGSLFDLQQLAGDRLPIWVQRLRDQPYQPLAKLAIMRANLQRLSQAGVPILTGTDAGNIGTLHASSYFEELGAMHEAGMSVAEILRASTCQPAQALGQQTGQIAAGYAADLVILERNPLDSLANWYPAYGVIRHGRWLQPEDLIPQTTENVVQQFLNAWRGGQYERMQSLLHPSIVHHRRGRQFAGPIGVGLIWKGKRVPPGIPQMKEQGQGMIRVDWGELAWVFEVKKGSIRKIYGP